MENFIMVMPNELEIHTENFLYNIKELLEELEDIDMKDELFSEFYADICANYRRMAIASLLLEADVEKFYRNLYNSSQAFLEFLSIANNYPSVDCYHLSTGRSYPLFDAIACNDLEAAKKISGLARHTFKQGEEYADDFYYYYFRHYKTSPVCIPKI